MPSNSREVPRDVRLIRRLFGLGKKRPAPENKGQQQPPVTPEVGKGSERISANAQAQISGQLGPDNSFRLAVSIEFEAGRLADQLGLNADDPIIQELAARTIKPVDTTEPDSAQYVGGTDILSNPQIKMDLHRPDRAQSERSDGLTKGI